MSCAKEREERKATISANFGVIQPDGAVFFFFFFGFLGPVRGGGGRGRGREAHLYKCKVTENNVLIIFNILA